MLRAAKGSSRNCAAQRRTCWVCTSCSATWAVAAARLQAQQRVVDHLHAAWRQAALDPQMFDVALQPLVEFGGHGAHARGLQSAAGISRSRQALATSPMRDRNSVPICAA